MELKNARVLNNVFDDRAFYQNYFREESMICDVINKFFYE